MMDNQQPTTTSTRGRLLSLDMLRGLTVAGMILVNNGYGESFLMLRHSRWNGLTPCDLVFPFFLFIMGISCYLSLSKSSFVPSGRLLTKIVRRTVLLFAIGLFINWFDHAIEGHLLCFGQLRLWAVLQRIALCYFFVSLFALYANHRYTLPTAAALLAVYTIILIAGNGYAEDASANILAQVDLSLFGYDHLYHKSPVDPEGLVGTISSVAHVLLGFWCGRLIKTGTTTERKALAVFVMGTVCLLAGYLLSYGLPLNKRIWSPSYALVTCGLAALLQALFIYIVDVKARPRTTACLTPLTVFGTNALALYVLSELLAIIFGHVGISDAIYAAVSSIVSQPKWASLAYALTFVAICYGAGLLLWRRKIFIKL